MCLSAGAGVELLKDSVLASLPMERHKLKLRGCATNEYMRRPVQVNKLSAFATLAQLWYDHEQCSLDCKTMREARCAPSGAQTEKANARL